MKLVWGHRNLEKIQGHGLSLDEVESAFRCPRLGCYRKR
jgi:hypothetical protein